MIIKNRGNKALTQFLMYFSDVLQGFRLPVLAQLCAAGSVNTSLHSEKKKVRMGLPKLPLPARPKMVKLTLIKPKTTSHSYAYNTQMKYCGS